MNFVNEDKEEQKVLFFSEKQADAKTNLIEIKVKLNSECVSAMESSSELSII